MAIPLSRALTTAALLSAACVYAQETTLLARDEPRHITKLLNEYIRVLEVHIPPGDQTLFHTHAVDYTFLNVMGGRVRNEMPGKEPADIDLHTDGFGYYRSAQGAVTHRFTNIGTTVFHAIGIELIGPMRGSSVTTPLPDQTGLKTVVDSERVRAYRVTVAPGATLGPLTFAAPGMRVGLVHGLFEERAVGSAATAVGLKPGQLQWRSAPVTYSVANNGSAPVSFIEYEFK